MWLWLLHLQHGSCPRPVQGPQHAIHTFPNARSHAVVQHAMPRSGTAASESTEPLSNFLRWNNSPVYLARFWNALCKTLPKIDSAYRTLVEFGHYADRGKIIVYSNEHFRDISDGVMIKCSWDDPAPAAHVAVVRPHAPAPAASTPSSTTAPSTAPAAAATGPSPTEPFTVNRELLRIKRQEMATTIASL